MASPNLSNANPSNQVVRPSFKARAAALKALAARVVRHELAPTPKPDPDPSPAPGSDEAKAAFKTACHQHTIRTQFATKYPELKRTPLEWWTAQSLSKALGSGEITPAECARLYPMATERELRMAEIEHELNLGGLFALAFANEYPVPNDATAEPTDWHNPPPGFMAHPAIEPMSFVNIPEGLRLELERLHDIAETEFERRAKAAEQGAHKALHSGFENRLRRQLRLDEIQAALTPERPVSAGTEAEGTVFYEDAAGNTRRAPVADWINFTSMRLYTVAHQELSRRFNVGCTADTTENSVLDAKLRRELRTDALFALAFRSQKVFEAAQAERYGTEEGIGAAGAEASPDPIFAAMQAAHYAKLAHDRFEERVKGDISNSADREEERRLMDADSRALAAVYTTTPTTRHGQLSLVHWIRDAIINAGCLNGEPADGHESVWADGYRALEAALLCPPIDQGKQARVQADAVDLSGCSIKGLARLSETFAAAADRWSDLSCLPYIEGDEAVAQVVNAEYERAGFVRERILGLLHGRCPKDDDERDEILGARLRYELDCEGTVRNPALLADIAAAWRA